MNKGVIVASYGMIGIFQCANTLNFFRKKQKLSKNNILNVFLTFPCAITSGATWPISFPLLLFLKKENTII